MYHIAGENVGAKRITGFSNIVEVPTSETVVVAVDAWIWAIRQGNPSGGAVTLTVKDGTGKIILPAVSFADDSHSNLEYNPPLKMAGGITWQASGTGLNVSIVATRD